jgi:hypothetical protein
MQQEAAVNNACSARQQPARQLWQQPCMLSLVGQAVTATAQQLLDSHHQQCIGPLEVRTRAAVGIAHLRNSNQPTTWQQGSKQQPSLLNARTGNS